MEKQKSFEDAVKPVIKWLNDNGHPHMTILITPTGAELVEGIKIMRTEEFLID